MEINIVENCGLCAGCKLAINTAKELLDKNEKVTIFKEIVHNKNVNNMLKKLGVDFEEDINQLNSNSVVIIRAHGEPPATYDILKEKNISFKDCTCFNVKRSHEQVVKFYNLGYSIIIIGKHKEVLHPEVLGTLGWSNNEAIIVQDEEDLKEIEKINNKSYVVCQTTFNIKKAESLICEIEKIFKTKDLELVVNKSICPSNELINLNSSELAKNCDLMIVVGGKNSSNTKELFNNLKQICPTVFVENIYDYKQELKNENIVLMDEMKIGLTAGASTMKEELQELKQLILSEFE